jgi:nucleotide-binding universal stress UspA family protein
MSTPRPGPIVVGVDESIASREAVVFAAWEAERRGLPLRLVHGYLVATRCLTPPAPLLDENGLLTSARDCLADTARGVHARRPHLSLTTRAVRETGGAALIEESATAGLVVVGAPHVRGFAGSQIGSVANQVLVAAHCPVLVVPRSTVVPARIPGNGPVLVGVDGGAPSGSGLGFGFEEASARGVPLVAVHVWSEPDLSGPSVIGAGNEVAADRERAQIQSNQAAERTLAEAVAGWQGQYPEVTVRRWVVPSFATARVLMDVAHEVSAGLIVVGSRRCSGASGTVFGSVSQTLVSHAVVPVAVVARTPTPHL